MVLLYILSQCFSFPSPLSVCLVHLVSVLLLLISSQCFSCSSPLNGSLVHLLSVLLLTISSQWFSYPSSLSGSLVHPLSLVLAKWPAQYHVNVATLLTASSMPILSHMFRLVFYLKGTVRASVFPLHAGQLKFSRPMSWPLLSAIGHGLAVHIGYRPYTLNPLEHLIYCLVH